MKNLNKVALTGLALSLTFGLVGLVAVKAATMVNLNTVDNFVILAASTVTNTGASVINGDIGLHPGTSITGFSSATVNGVEHLADANALQAQTDLTAAYLNAAGQTPVTTVATELGGTTKTAGIYDSASGDFGITGTLTLDGQNNPDSVFIFKTSSTLVTAGSSNVILINGAQACHVFWQVGSSATLGTNSTFKGNLLALISATLTTGANVEGRILSRNGAVTLNNNTITKATCAAPIVTPTPTPVLISEPTPIITPVIISVPTTTPITIAPVSIALPVVKVVTTKALVSVPSFPSAGVDPESK